VGYRLVLEDGPDVCDSEGPAEYSDHGDELTGMYTPGYATPGQPRMTEEQMDRLRKRGMAGGQDTGLVRGVKKSDPAMFDQNETRQRDDSS
jgi:hypothetical protein